MTAAASRTPSWKDEDRFYLSALDSPLEPPRAGDVLRACLKNIDGLTQENLAEALMVSRHSVSELVNGKRSVTPLMALKLGYVLSMDPSYWMSIQATRDLYDANKVFKEVKQDLKVLREPRVEEA
jgi:addiction module HigA family antidote